MRLQTFSLATFFLLATVAIFSSGIQDHFKKITNKSDIHKMGEVDYIYMINLDQRPEKFALSQKLLAPYGIYPYRFSAVNGWELSLRTINSLGVPFKPGMLEGIKGTSYFIQDEGKATHGIIEKPGQIYFCHCMSRGAIGIVLSHLSILQDAYDSGYKTIWVMEDDVEIVRDPRTLTTLIQKLDAQVGQENWDVLFTDRDTKSNDGKYVPCLAYSKRPNFIPKNLHIFSLHQPVGKDFMRIGARYGAYSMIVRKSGMKKILDFIKTYKIFFPYDMDFMLPPGIKLYAVIDDVVSTRINSPSDNGGPHYLENNSVKQDQK